MQMLHDKLKLAQVLGIEKNVKNAHTSNISALHKANQKPDLFSGFQKRFQPLDEQGEKLPDEKKTVQARVPLSIAALGRTLVDLLDVEATKDVANLKALASIIIDGVEITRPMPTTFLLSLEKQCQDLATFIAALPTLDPAELWTHDDNLSVYRSAETTTHRTKKVAKAFELSPATKEHPAQVNLVHEDVIVGHWKTEHLSGAISVPQKEQLMGRITALLRAVKIAIHEANGVDAVRIDVGQDIFNYLFKK